MRVGGIRARLGRGAGDQRRPGFARDHRAACGAGRARSALARCSTCRWPASSARSTSAATTSVARIAIEEQGPSLWFASPYQEPFRLRYQGRHAFVSADDAECGSTSPWRKGVPGRSHDRARQRDARPARRVSRRRSDADLAPGLARLAATAKLSRPFPPDPAIHRGSSVYAVIDRSRQFTVASATRSNAIWAAPEVSFKITFDQVQLLSRGQSSSASRSSPAPAWSAVLGASQGQADRHALQAPQERAPQDRPPAGYMQVKIAEINVSASARRHGT